MAFLDYSGLSHFFDKIKALFVTGPSSSTDARVATFDGTTGKKIKDSGYTIAKSVPSDAKFTDTTYTFDGTYNASTNKAATVSTVTTAIGALDGNLNNTTPGAAKTLTAFSETDGKVSATFGNISITKSQVSDFPTLGGAAAKAVDTSISAASTSANLPTSAAVASFVEGKGYKTTDNDTKNTAGTTNKTGTKMYLAAATEQSANPQTYSNSNVYIGTDNCLYSGGTKVLTAHQDISGKKNTQSAVSDPSASGTSVTFIATISQNAQGVISPTKKTVSTMGAATSSAAGSAGLVPAPAKGDQTKFLRGDGTWSEPGGKSTVVQATASAGSWQSGTYPTQNITVAGVTASNNIEVGVDGAAIALLNNAKDVYEAATEALILCTAQATNSITLTCYGTEPTENIPIAVLIVG